MIDFDTLEADGQELPSDEALKSLADLVQEYVDTWRRLLDADAEVERLEAAVKMLLEKRIPDVMAAAGVAEFKLTDGTKLSSTPVVFASIPNDRKQLAHAWLRENNHGSLIKTEIKASLGKGQDEQAAALRKALNDAGVDFTANEGVHWQTLRAFAAEQLKKGVEIPRDVFGIHEVTVANVAPPTRLPKRKEKK